MNIKNKIFTKLINISNYKISIPEIISLVAILFFIALIQIQNTQIMDLQNLIAVQTSQITELQNAMESLVQAQESEKIKDFEKMTELCKVNTVKGNVDLEVPKSKNEIFLALSTFIILMHLSFAIQLSIHFLISLAK